MKLPDLEAAVLRRKGQFFCHQVHKEKNTKVVSFRHVAGPVAGEADFPDIGRLQDFYDTFGSLLFYHDEKSEEAARYIAPPPE
jgi:hypothetical protein